MAHTPSYTCDICEKGIRRSESVTFCKGIHLFNKELNFRFEFLGISVDSVMMVTRDFCEECKARSFLEVTKRVVEDLEKEVQEIGLPRN